MARKTGAKSGGKSDAKAQALAQYHRDVDAGKFDKSGNAKALKHLERMGVKFQGGPR